jgi:glycosyltransferase involved in cell wall biosynthesis
MLGFVVAGIWAGLRHARAWRPDLIHVHFAVPSGPVAWALSRLTSIPYVLTAHLGDVPGGVSEKTGRWFRWIYPFTPPIWKDAAAVVAVSQHTRQLALQHYPVEVTVIPNGVDLSQRSVEMIHSAPSPNASHLPSIVFAGRFVPQKNPLLLVQTLAALRHLDWQCTLVGDGPLRPQVEAEIHKFNLQDRFHLPGWVTSEEVIDWFTKSDILFMPSLSEGLPVVGLNALAAGLALVVSGVGGFVDLVDEGQNGFLISAGDAEGYQQALQALLSNPQRLQAFRQASLRKAQDFDLNKVVEAYEILFQQVLRQKSV